MKRLISALLFSVLASSLSAQVNDYGQAYRAFWQNTDAEFKNPDTSPLPAQKIADFDSVPRYSYNPNYRVKAIWEPVANQKPFKIEASGSRRDTYQKVALIHFIINGDSLVLSAYQNLNLMRDSGYHDYIFVPFTDETNTVTTYGGGRYIDFSRPKGDAFILDFNLAYNPYCVYNHNYSCPIPPQENNLKIKIEAGARTEY